MDFAADFRNANTDFGTPATVGGVAVTGIYDAAYQDALGIGGSGPMFRCPSASIPAAVAGSPVTIGAASYTIAGPVEHDGTGMATLHLRDA
jgi:hypothetical protein